VELSNASGIDGGYPGAGSQVSVIRQSRVLEKLRRSEIPMSYDEFGGTVEHLASKSDGQLSPGDVFIFYPPGGGGYGDPLERDPELVRQDVARAAVTVEGALRHYGVVVTPDGRVDEEGTRREREGRIRQRLGRLSSGARETLSEPGEVIRQLGEHLEEARVNGSRVVRCRLCHVVLCSADEDPRQFAVRRERSLTEAGPWLALPWKGESPHFVLVESICPSCGVLFDVEEKLKAAV
jgi:N-methylhydantoinase B